MFSVPENELLELANT